VSHSQLSYRASFSATRLHIFEGTITFLWSKLLLHHFNLLVKSREGNIGISEIGIPEYRPFFGRY
jgi:hypothetical protein